MYLCTYVHMYTCTFVYMYMYVYMYIRIYIYTRMCIYIYIYHILTEKDKVYWERGYMSAAHENSYPLPCVCARTYASTHTNSRSLVRARSLAVACSLSQVFHTFPRNAIGLHQRHEPQRLRRRGRGGDRGRGEGEHSQQTQ